MLLSLTISRKINRFRGILAFAVLTAGNINAQEPQTPPAVQTPPADPAPPVAKEAPADKADPQDDGVRVSVIGYHDFTATGAETEMRIGNEKFRKQMTAIRDLGIPVISMEDFVAWKRGQKDIPKRAIVITIDDGWKTVYTEAYPVLKEFKYPFTVFLYKQYVDGGGLALSSPMIQEMMQNGMSIGSHSVSHPLPGRIKRAKAAGLNQLDQFLNKEMGDSKKFLEEKFKQKIPTYAYPGGFFMEEMFPIADKYGYEFLFTVLPGKTKRDTDNKQIPRYIILGNYDRFFEMATSFQATAGTTTEASSGAIVQSTVVPVEPSPGSVVEERLPTVNVDFSTITDLDTASINMEIAGFGNVPAKWDASSGLFSWTINRPLRQRSCDVTVRYKRLNIAEEQAPIRWTFMIDRDAAYMPREEEIKSSTNQ